MIDNIILDKRERRTNAQKKWYLKNKDKRAIYMKVWSKEYYQKNKDRKKKKSKEYYLKNKDKVREYHRKYHLLNKEKANEDCRKWYLKNKENLILQHLRKRHEAINNPELGFSYTKEYRKLRKMKRRGGGPLTIQTIQQVYEDNIKLYGTLTCYLCYKIIEFGKDSVDHKTPISRSGTNEYSNLGIAHIDCNRRKHNKTEEEYRNWLATKKEVISNGQDIPNLPNRW